MVFSKKTYLIGLSLLITGIANADSLSNDRFKKDDWLLVCDNHKTCRAAGYSIEDFEEKNRVSVLLTRTNDNQPIIGKMIYNTPETLTQPFTLMIDGKSYGQVALSAYDVLLSSAQVNAIIATANQQAKIEFISGNQVFLLSDDGLAAVLLKMDDIQQRVNTPTALIAKGEQPFYPQAAKVTALRQEADFLQKTPRIISRNSREGKRVLALLRATINSNPSTIKPETYCPDVADIDAQPVMNADIEVLQISYNKKLVMTSCWTAAYNTGKA